VSAATAAFIKLETAVGAETLLVIIASNGGCFSNKFVELIPADDLRLWVFAAAAVKLRHTVTAAELHETSRSLRGNSSSVWDFVFNV